MKTTLFILSFLLSGSVAFSQSPATPLGTQVAPVNAAVDVPSIVNEKFSSQYPNIKAEWSAQGEHYKAEFLKPGAGEKSRVYYDQHANVVREDHPVPSDKILAPIKMYHKTHFPSDKLLLRETIRGEVHQFYFVQNKDTLRFNDEGRKYPLISAEPPPPAQENR